MHKLLKNRASHNKRDGFSRERATFGDEMISVVLLLSKNFKYQHRTIVFNFGIFRGSFGHFYTLTALSRDFMCINQI